jgi:hypothetical protein
MAGTKTRVPMQVTLAVLVALPLITLACAKPTPTPDPVATQVAIALAVEGTLTALAPTPMPIPTTTPTPTPLPSATPTKRPSATRVPPTRTPPPPATQNPQLPVMRQFAQELQAILNDENLILKDYSEFIAHMHELPREETADKAWQFMERENDLYVRVGNLSTPPSLRSLRDKALAYLQARVDMFGSYSLSATTLDKEYVDKGAEAGRAATALQVQVWDDLEDLLAWLNSQK